MGGRHVRRTGALLAVAAGLAGGCRHHAPARPAAAPTVVLEKGVPDLPVVTPVSLQPDLATLPKPGDPPPRAGATHRGLTGSDAQCLAARNAASANLLDDEDRTPPAARKHGATAADPADGLRRQVRGFAARELRNRAAGEALERYFQLADGEARGALLRESLGIFEALRDTARRAKAAGARYPLDPDDLDRQRSTLLAQVAQADAGVAVANLDLRRRIGLPPSAAERLWPTTPFDVPTASTDAEAAVAVALADRPELRGLRALYHGLNAATLPAVREQLRSVSPLLGVAVARTVPSAAKPLVRLHGPAADAALAAEVAVRRRQLFELIAERERAVADETRAAAVLLDSQTGRVALARGRAESWRAKVDDLKRQRAANLPGADLQESQATLESLKARSEVVAEVMAWHQARVRLKAAQGRLIEECDPPGPPPAAGCGPCGKP